MSRLSDFEIPADWPDFPTHDLLCRWWQSYADAFGLRERIALESEVVEARPLDAAGWQVRIRAADGSVREERYDALLACSGSYWDPRLPDLAGHFDGELFHARAYRDPTTPVDLAGKHVVVVGIGNTGCELACEIAKAGAASVSLSARSGTWILSKRVDGRPAANAAPMMHPLDPVPGPFRALPASLREKLFERMGTRMFKRMFGARMQRLQELGMPPPPPRPVDKRATVCDPLLECLESGIVKVRPGIERLDGSEVLYSDGSREPADVVLCATGYHLRYPYLSDGLVEDEDVRVFQGTLHHARHDLFFVGVSRPTGAFWPIAEQHATFAAALLSGRYRFPGARRVRSRAMPMLGRRAFNPALYGLALREEIRRGERRAERSRR